MWSYSGNPATGSKDAVRFLIPDREANAPLLQDEEIEWEIAEEAGDEPTRPGLYRAAAGCCEVLSRLFSAQADTQFGELKEAYSKQAAGYTERAKELRARAQGLGEIFVGGTSVAAQVSKRENTGAIQPLFRKRQFRNPWRDGDGPARLDS